MMRPEKNISPARRGAFTLVEVLATLVLLGILLPVAMRGVSIGLAAASSARHTSEAASLANVKLNEIAIEGMLNSGTSGNFAPEHPDFAWKLQSLPRDYGLSELALRVTWTERGQERNLDVSTLAYDTESGVTP